MSAIKGACRNDRIDMFVAGQLDDLAAAELERHVEACTVCDQRLIAAMQVMEQHPLHDEARSFLSGRTLDVHTDASVSPGNPVDDGLWRRILDPTDDPRMLGRLGGYEIAGVIGIGGMGLVLKAWDVSLDRFVAIKVLHPNRGVTAESEQRFAREAQVAASVVHDNVIPIYGVSQHHGMPYLVMPYIRGESLQVRIDRESPMAVETALEISLQIARGLAAAHQQGLVHRDIKPSNILLPADVSRVQITDFGLARAIDDDKLTSSGIIAGTPQYMSPEQARGDAVDGRTDQFSLGSVMYAMLTGQSPFQGESTYRTLGMIIEHKPPYLADVSPTTPRWLADMIERLLSKNAEHRFESTAELAQTLEDCLAHLRQPATIELPKFAVWKDRPTRKPTRKVVLITLITSLFLVVGLFFAFQSRRLSTATSPVVQDSLSVDSSSITSEWIINEESLTQIEEEIELINLELDKDVFSAQSVRSPK